MALLNVKNISIKLGRKEILKNISFQLDENEIVGLIGPNGSGKSTLLNILSGNLGGYSGEIIINGKELSKKSLAERAKKIAYLPQETEISFPIAIRQVVELGRVPYLASFAKTHKEGCEVVGRAMRKVGIEHIADKQINKVSGGEKILACVARTIVQETPIVLADEPTQSLDLINAERIMKIFSEISSVEKKTILVVSHDIELIKRFCRKVVVLKNGEIAFLGSSKEILTPSNLLSVFAF